MLTPGAGTKMAITTHSPSPICLDLTRLISRVGRGPMTGIDRVEFAYLRTLSAGSAPFWVLVKDHREFILLDQSAARDLLNRLWGLPPWGARDVRSRFYRRHSKARQAAQSHLRRVACRRVGRSGLGPLLQEVCGSGLRYLNVGHSNIDTLTFAAVKSVAEARIIVLLHDVIPLDFPAFQTPETVMDFDRKLGFTSEWADLVICPSEHSRTRTEFHLGAKGRIPPITVAHLGIEQTQPSPQALPSDLDLGRPYFVTLGTIEPRKNHILLLDVWERLGEDAPDLFIVGRRGWGNEEVFARLDTGPPHIFELNDLSDSAVAALLQGSLGLLFPSFVEGFGLPPAEAARLGVPVICSDLPVCREVLGDSPVYLSASDSVLWEAEIRDLIRSGSKSDKRDQPKCPTVQLPTWDDHFNIVLKVL